MLEKGKAKVEEKKELKEDEMKTKDEGKKDDNYKSKEEGKLGVYWFKDSGHKKHGWKNVYHKEEWGDSKKFHDIFHDKDWKKKWNKWDNSKEKSKRSKYQSDKERYASKKLADEKKFAKGGHKKWKHEHGSGYEKKEHLDSHSEDESHEKKSHAQRVKGKQSKNNRSVILKQPNKKVSSSSSSSPTFQKYPSAKNFHGHRHTDYDTREQDHHHDHHHDHPESGKEEGEEEEGGSAITDSIDFGQTSFPEKKKHGWKHKTKVFPYKKSGSKGESGSKKSGVRSEEEKEGRKGKEKTKSLKDVTSRRVKHYPDEQLHRKRTSKMQKVEGEEEDQDSRKGESEEVIRSSMTKNPKYFNRSSKKSKKKKVIEIESNHDEEDEDTEVGNEGDIEEEGDGEQETSLHEEEEGGGKKKRSKDKDGLRSNHEVVGSKHGSNEPVYYYSSNKVLPLIPFKQEYNSFRTEGNQEAVKTNANLRDHKSKEKYPGGGQAKKFYSVPNYSVSQTGHPSSSKQHPLLVSPPSPSSSAPLMYPSIPMTASTTIYEPTVPIIEQPANTFQTPITTSSSSSPYFVPSHNLIHRKPGLAFLSVLKSLTSVPSPVSTFLPSTLLASSSSPTPTTSSFSSSLVPSASTPSLTRLLHQPRIPTSFTFSSPSPTHISSFSYHLQQLRKEEEEQKKKSINKPSR